MISEILEGLFKKRKSGKIKKSTHYQVESENLAVPEVHVGHGEDAPAAEKEETQEKESITYENVAIPEIHVHHEKK